MRTEIKRVYREALPKMKLVGKRYGEADKVNGFFGQKWSEWFANDWFAPLKTEAAEEPFPDCDAFIGLCRVKEGEPFQYWIGVFLPTDFPVPAGYDSVTLEAGDVGVAWVYGKEPDVYTACCLACLREHGMEWTCDSDGAKWCFERYVCPRFTQPDEQGNIILDLCYYVKETPFDHTENTAAAAAAANQVPST